MRSFIVVALLAVLPAGCAGAGSSGAMPIVSAPPSGSLVPTPGPAGASGPAGTPVTSATASPADSRLQLPSGFVASVVARVPGARELAALSNGDLIVGTTGISIAIVPNAESAGAAQSPATFATFPEAPEGVAFGDGYVFAATEHAVWRIAYSSGAQSGTPQRIATVRSGPIAPNSDGDVHHSTSVAVSGTTLFVSVGSSCNACSETDPTRATVQRMGIDGSGMTTQARRVRNAIALATDPATGTVWAGDAGQDALPQGHPYEFLDPVSSRTAPADYGWPDCEENHVAYTSGADCSAVVVPQIEFPAYSTIVGAAFYSANQSGVYAFPVPWRGGLFVGLHGSWHATNGIAIDPPHVAFVPFSGGTPARAVDWNDPATQWNDFFTGFQDASGNRIGRVTGIAVGSAGSLFVADDQSGTVYRIRPASSAAGAQQRR